MFDTGTYILRHVQEIDPSLSLTSSSKNFWRMSTKKLRYNYTGEHQVFSKANVSLENQTKLRCDEWTRRNVKLRKTTDGANEKNRTSWTPVGHAFSRAPNKLRRYSYVFIFVSLDVLFPRSSHKSHKLSQFSPRIYSTPRNGEYPSNFGKQRV